MGQTFYRCDRPVSLTLRSRHGQVAVDSKDGEFASWGRRFQPQANTALADQNSFRKATQAYVEYQNKGLGELGLKPEDLGANTTIQANLMARQSNK